MSRSPFLYASSSALRAPWRIVIFLVVTFVAWGIAATLVAPALVPITARAGVPGTVESDVAVIGLLCGHFVSVRLVDKRPWSAFWMGRAAARPAKWLEGFGIGALAIGLPCLALMSIGALHFVAAAPGSWAGAALRLTWFLLPAALMEELLTRGYVFAVLRESAGWPVALAVTSIVFGLLHLPNNGATIETITMVTLAGVLLGGVILATGSLYAAWMAHFAWNWVMAVPLHSPVSGFPLATPNYRLLDAGPRWLTGGAWGPEGGLAAAAGMVAALVYLYARRRRREES